jgi:hypothetical protein
MTEQDDRLPPGVTAREAAWLRHVIRERSSRTRSWRAGCVLRLGRVALEQRGYAPELLDDLAQPGADIEDGGRDQQRDD